MFDIMFDSAILSKVRVLRLQKPIARKVLWNCHWNELLLGDVTVVSWQFPPKTLYIGFRNSDRSERVILPKSDRLEIALKLPVE